MSGREKQKGIKNNESFAWQKKTKKEKRRERPRKYNGLKRIIVIRYE